MSLSSLTASLLSRRLPCPHGPSACLPAPSPRSRPTVLRTADVQLAAPDPISPASFHSSGRSPEGALPAGVWPCSARSPCTGGQQTPSSTGSRSCLVRSPGRKQQGEAVRVVGTWGGGSGTECSIVRQLSSVGPLPHTLYYLWQSRVYPCSREKKRGSERR